MHRIQPARFKKLDALTLKIERLTDDLDNIAHWVREDSLEAAKNELEIHVGVITEILDHLKTLR